MGTIDGRVRFVRALGLCSVLAFAAGSAAASDPLALREAAKVIVEAYSQDTFRHEAAMCRTEAGLARMGCRLDFMGRMSGGRHPVRQTDPAQAAEGFWTEIERACPGPSNPGKWICLGAAAVNLSRTGEAFPGVPAPRGSASAEPAEGSGPVR